MATTPPVNQALLNTLIFSQLNTDGTPMNPADFLTEDTLGRDDGVRGANESLTATSSGASQETIYDLTRIIGAAYDRTAQSKLVFAIAQDTPSAVSDLFGVTQDGMIFFKGLTEEFREMADTPRSWTLRVYVGTLDASLQGKVDYVDVDLRLRSLHDRFIYNHIDEDGDPESQMDFFDGPGVIAHRTGNRIDDDLYIDEETASLPKDHPGFNAVNGGIVDLTTYVPNFRDDRLLFAIDPAAPDMIKNYFTLDGEGVLYYTGPALDHETLDPADRMWMIRVFVASAEGYEGDPDRRPPGTPTYTYEGKLDVATLHVKLRDIDEAAPVIIREDVPNSHQAYEPLGTLTKVVTNIDDPDIVLFDFGVMGDDSTITWTTSSINSGFIYFKVDDEGKVRFSDAPTKLAGLDDNIADDVGVRITATSASGKSDSIDLGVRVLVKHLQTEVLVNRSDLLAATPENGAFIIDLNTLYHIEYERFAVAAPFSISDVEGAEDYGKLKFIGEHSAHIDSYEVMVSTRTVSHGYHDFITVNVKLDGGDAIYTIGTTGSDIRNPYVGDVLSFTRTQDDPDGHNANVAEVHEWFYADAPETTLATTTTYTLTAADIGKQVQLRVRYDDRFGAEGDEVSPTKDVATAIATGVVSAIGATAPYLETSADEISIPQSIAGIATAQSFTITDADTTAFTTASFTITGTHASKFEVRQVNSEWRLALKAGQELDFTDADEYKLSVHVADEGGRNSNSVDVVVSGAYYSITGDGYDALARVVHVGDVLTSQQNYDAPTAPAGTRTYHWFHTDAPNTAIGTEHTYTLKASDAGKQVQLRVTYTDAAGTSDSVTLPPTTYVSANIGASVPHLAVVGAPSVSIEDYVEGLITEKTFIVTDNNFDYLFSEESFTITGAQASKFKFEVRQIGEENTASIEWHLALKDGHWLTLDDGSEFTLSVTVTDRDGYTSNSVDILVSVQNTNHNAPVLSLSNATPTTITEGEAGVDTGLVFAIADADSNNQFSFDIDGAVGSKFDVVADDTGWKLKLRAGMSLDYETETTDGRVELQVKVNDGVRDSNIVPVAFNIQNANDAPMFPTTSYVLEVAVGTAIGTEVLQLAATDPDGDTLTYSVRDGSHIGAYFTLDKATGALSLTQALPEFYFHTLVVQVSDGLGHATANVAITSVRDSEITTPTPEPEEEPSQATYGFATSDSAHDAPEPYLTLTAVKLTDDPDGHDGAEIYEWYHVSDYYFAVIGTGATYEVQESDIGKQLRFRVKYSDDAGNEEVVIGGTSGVVAASGLGLTAAETSASITENMAGMVFSNIVLAPTLNDAPIPALTADAFTISGDQADKFEIRVVNSAFTLALKPRESLDYESVRSLTLNVEIDHDGSKHRTPDLTINVDNVDEGSASYFIDNTGDARTAPSVYTILTARRSTFDPDQHDVGIPSVYEWFHVHDPDTTIGTGTTYQVQASDIGAQINFRAKYRDLGGTDEIVTSNVATASVRVRDLDIGASATSATIDENSAGAESGIIFAPTINGGIPFDKETRDITSFSVTGGADKFEVVKDGAVWKLKLKPLETLNFETNKDGIDLNVIIKLNGNPIAAPLPVTISVGDVYEGDIGASATSATIDENIAGAESGITFTPALNGVAFASNRVALSINDDTIGADRFEIVQDAGVWKLKLKATEMFDFETNSDDIVLNLVFSLDGDVLGDPLPVTISVGNADEGWETLYLITPGATRDNPQVGTTLYAQRSPKSFRIDPDGHDESVPEIFEWFHVSDPDTTLGTGRSYKVQESDIGEQLRFRATYRDLSGTDEVVISSERSISGVVVAARLVLGESATTGTINEGTAGAFSDITFTPLHDNIDITDNINSNSFTISSDVAGVSSKFRIARDGTEWKLKLIDAETFDAETATISTFNIRVQLLYGANLADVDLTINIGNVDEGDAQYFIAPGLGRDHPELGTILTAQRDTRLDRQDPDGYDDSVPVVIEWFHVSDPDTTIGTGEIYTVQASDAGEQLRFRAKYRDGSGTDEVVLANENSISGVVMVNLLTLTLSATSTTINENSAGAVSDLTLTPDLGGIAITLTSDSFRITGDADASKFKVVQDAGVWKLKLKDGVTLDAEATNSINLNIAINQDGNTSAIQTLTVNVGNVDEGRETPYFISSAVRNTPEPGTELTANRSTKPSNRDPDGHDNSVPDQFEWFHIDSPDVVIGTGRTYIVQTSDVGEQIRFRVTYRDLSGTDEVVLANTGSITGVVTLDGTARIALVASATTASIDENLDGASTDIEFSVYDGGEHAFTSTDFTITGTESEHFEVARNDAGNWHLRLKPGHSLDYESTTSLTLQVRVSDGTNQSNSVNNIVISVTDQENEDVSPTLLATLDLAAIYENHPTDKLIAAIETPANLASTGGGVSLALASTGTNDNALFRLDAGKLYWKSAPDFETPQDADSDNSYEIDIIFTASDGTKYLRKHTLNVQDIGPGRHGYDASMAPDGGFGSYTLPYENVPQEARPSGLASYIIDGYAKIMPDEGPLIFTWSLHDNSIYEASEVRVYLDEAFDAFEDAANLKFIEVASDSDIVINFQSRGSTGALGEAHPYITPMAINYYLNSKSEFEGMGFYRTLTHEIGHVLGLKHPFEASAESTSWLSDLAHNYNVNTMMSYAKAFGFIDRGTPLLPIDVAALQFLYGAPGGDSGDSAERFLKFEANRDYIHAVSERSLDWHPAKLIEISDALSIGTAFYNVLHADTLSRLQSQISNLEYKSSIYTIDSTYGDAAFFEISESGAISLKQNLDADTPQDSYGSKAYVENNVYEIKIDAVHTYGVFGRSHIQQSYGYLGIEVVDDADIVPLTLTLSATSTTINENSAGAVSDITLTPALNGVAITTLTADDFSITGDQANKFGVALDGGVWKLKLKTGESLDAETTTSPMNLNLFIYQDGKVSAIQTLTINVGNVDEGDETPYFISSTARNTPEPGTELTANRSTNKSKRDPDGHDNSVPDQFEWFHIDSPDVVIGTGKTYIVQTSDVGEQIRFRVTYRDLSGIDEVVLANTGSITGIVTLDGTARIALVASATSASIDEDTDGASTDIEFSVYDGAEHAFTSTDFTITGTESEHFEVARNQAGNWHLRLKPGHSLNYESISSLNLQVVVSDGTDTSNRIDNIAINVNNLDDGDATIAITGTDVEVGTALSYTYTEDPDGLAAGTSASFNWFYARDPDTSIGTGATYTISEDDRGEYIGVRVTYTDTLGARVVEDISDDPVPHVIITPTNQAEPNDDATYTAQADTASKIDAGDGADTITGGNRNDVIDGGGGDDVIDLGDSTDDADQIIYGIGDQTAADGSDRITNFHRGKDQFVIALESNDETDHIDSYEDFLNYIAADTPDYVRDDQFMVQVDVEYSGEDPYLEGIYLHFSDSSFFSGGRISMPFIHLGFAESLDFDGIVEIFGDSVEDLRGKFNSNGILTDLNYFDDLLGGEGSVGYELLPEIV